MFSARFASVLTHFTHSAVPVGVYLQRRGFFGLLVITAEGLTQILLLLARSSVSFVMRNAVMNGAAPPRACSCFPVRIIYLQCLVSMWSPFIAVPFLCLSCYCSFKLCIGVPLVNSARSAGVVSEGEYPETSGRVGISSTHWLKEQRGAPSLPHRAAFFFFYG